MGAIRTIGGEDQSSYYEIWEGVQAIIGMCIRFGNWGRAIKRGMCAEYECVLNFGFCCWDSMRWGLMRMNYISRPERATLC